MADNYDDYEPSDSYGEEEVQSGGEQIASALYVNETVQNQQEQIDLKPTISLQPTTPPENPKTGDMWIDRSLFPWIAYTWDGVQWGRSTAISADEVGAYTVAQADEQRSQVELDLSALDSRTTNMEQKTTPDSIADTVTQHQTYKTDRDAAVQEGVDGFQDNLNDEDWVNTNLPKMVTESILERKADAITAKFAKGGGVNLLHNSVGYAGLLNWQLNSGVVEQAVGDDMIDSKSGFYIETGAMTQTRGAIIGESYTMTLKVKKGTAGTAYLRVSDGTNFQQVNMAETQAYDYTTIQVANFIPVNPILMIEIGATGASAIFTSLMLNTGEVGYQWSLANGELYNTAVQMDINGLNVKSSVYDGYTVMSPEEFSGYARNGQGVMEKVFTLNKDTTEMNKAAVDNEITLGTVKMIKVIGGGNSGWAFVPSS